MSALRGYALVTAAYWAFTVTDGALRLLVLLHFHALGYDPIALAFLFVFYELFGVVTNLFGGLVAARAGLKVTLTGGLALQVLALALLSRLDPAWPRAASVAYVMAAQALSGVAKDLTKMSAKSSIKALVPDSGSAAGPGAGSGAQGGSSSLFKWVALLTGSKNALKGAGFFVGGLLLSRLGFRGSLLAMSAALLLVLALAAPGLPPDLGRAKHRPKFSALLSKSRAINLLAAARFFLFGARDLWFVVGAPVYLASRFGFGFTEVGALLAAWVVGYGAIQSVAPSLISRFTGGRAPEGAAATGLAFLLASSLALTAIGLHLDLSGRLVLLGGLGLFGAIFAVNSSVHSYLILAWSDGDKVALNVGFYYMANAGGRLVGALLSGVMYRAFGIAGCLWASVAFAACAGLLSRALPRGARSLDLAAVEIEAGD